MIPLAVALQFGKKYWREITIGLMSLTAWHLSARADHWHSKTETCEAARKADKKSFEAAAERAKADNLIVVRTTEKKWEGVVTETEDDYAKKLASANAAVRAYADRVRIKATTGPSGQGRVPSPTGTPEGVDGTGASPFVPVSLADLGICAENTVKAESWPIFYKGLQDEQAN